MSEYKVTVNETQVVLTSQVVGLQGATGAKGDTGATGASGVIAVNAPITNSGTSTSANLGFDSTGFVKTAIANTFTTGAQLIQTGADAIKGLIIKRNSPTQSANLMEFQMSTGTNLAWIDKDGKINAPDFIDLGMSTAGVVTNNSSGLLQSSTNLSTSLGGTGHGFGSPLLGRAHLNASYTKAVNDTTPEAVFRNASGTIQYFNVDADTTYFIDGLLHLTQIAATAAAPRLSLIYINTGTTTTLTEQSALLRYNSSFATSTYISSAQATAANTNADLSFTSSAGFNHFIAFRAIIRTNATTAGRINLGATQTVTGATAPVFVGGSYINIYKMGTGAISTFGNWS